MAKSPYISEVSENEVMEAVSLHNFAYKTNRTLNDWIWEYKGKIADKFVFVVAKDEGKIVGTQGMIPILINVAGKPTLSGKSENSLLSPNYRGKDLFRRMYEFAMTLCEQKGMSCVWGFTSATKVWKDKLSFSVYVDTMQTCSKVLNLNLALARARKLNHTGSRKLYHSLVVLLGFLYSKLRNPIYGSKITLNANHLVVERLPKSMDDIQKLYCRLRRRYPNLISIEQNEEYYRWRIADNPNNNYQTYFLYEKDMLRAYCYAHADEGGVMYITDLAYVDDDACTFLLQYVLTAYSKQNVGLVMFMGNKANPIIRDLFGKFKKFGFLRMKSAGMEFVLKDISNKETIYNIENWFLDGLWTEGFTW